MKILPNINTRNIIEWIEFSSFFLVTPLHEPENGFDPWVDLGNELKLHTPFGCIASNEVCTFDEQDDGLGENLIINGITFRSRSFTHPPISMAFELHRKYDYFKACFDVINDSDNDDQTCDEESGKMKIQVLGDGVPIKMNTKRWMTVSIKQNPYCFMAKVGNVSMLELRYQRQFHVSSCGLVALVDAKVFLKGK